jgi:TonB family protein
MKNVLSGSKNQNQKVIKMKKLLLFFCFTCFILSPILYSLDIYRLINELQKIYNIENVEHLSSGIMLWDGKKDQLSGLILLDKTSYPLLFTPKMLSHDGLDMRIQVSRSNEVMASQDPEGRLLDTKMVMRADTPYVLGFPSEGARYFLSISFVRKKAGQYEEKEYSKLIPQLDLTLTPEPVHTVIPSYPPNCLEEKIEGKVLIQVNINKQGHVMDVEIMSSAHPDLDNAAAEALKQWEFHPLMKKEKPVSVKFPVIIDFKLRDETGPDTN